jgi:hypothetical protein
MEVLARSVDHECDCHGRKLKAICLGLSRVGCTRDVLSSATAFDKRIEGAVLSAEHRRQVPNQHTLRQFLTGHVELVPHDHHSEPPHCAVIRASCLLPTR